MEGYRLWCDTKKVSKSKKSLNTFLAAPEDVPPLGFIRDFLVCWSCLVVMLQRPATSQLSPSRRALAMTCIDQHKIYSTSILSET